MKKYLITNERLVAGSSYTLRVPIEQRLLNPSSTINFVINSFQIDSNDFEGASVSGAKLSSGELYTNSQILPEPPNNVYPNDITITIPVNNDT
jgi:hypothetical protein